MRKCAERSAPAASVQFGFTSRHVHLGPDVDRGGTNVEPASVPGGHPVVLLGITNPPSIVVGRRVWAYANRHFP